MRYFLFVIMLLTFTVRAASAATFDPSFKFVTIETGHFTLYFHQGLEETGQRAAVIAEEVHEKLTPLFKWTPREKTNIVIADNSDFANGMATVIPYNAIYLQAVLPAAASSIGSYDDWLRLLISHEYAHILTSDPVRGYSETMRRIFGKVYPVDDPFGFLFFLIAGPPNTMMPRWWHEGMATWAETELTASGRGRNSYYQMVYRTAVAENNLPSIDRINGETPNWPAGNSPYIYGSSLIQYIADKYGKEKPADLSIQQSGRFPYFINTPPEQYLGGRNYQRLYGEMLLKLRQEQRKNIELLSSEPFTSLIMVGKKVGMEQVPRFSRDGSMLAFNRDDGHSHPAIVIQDKNGKEIAKIRRDYGEGGLCWSPDNQRLFFSQAALSLAGNLYQDLYSYNLKEKKVRRLTKGARASDPDLSPDGRKLLFITKSVQSQQLAMIDLSSLDSMPETVPEVIRNYADARLSSPRWAPDNKNILFIKTGNTGRSTLHLVDSAAKTERELLSTDAAILAACWHPDGRSIIYSADINGVFNLHSLDPASGNSTQITHVLGGIMSADISPADGTLVVEHYSSEGFTTALITKESLRKLPVAAPAVAPASYQVSRAMLPTPGLQEQTRLK
ncbi:MAG: peptidase S9, partial [Geobacter sp.]|nr:peptidase S9 [Geobacter sp.]